MKILIEKCPNILTTLDKNTLIFVLKTGFGCIKILFWAKIFNVFNLIQYDLTSPNFITLFLIEVLLIFRTLEGTLQIIHQRSPSSQTSGTIEC